MGRVEAITGEMFCGKTEELQKRLNRATYAKQEVLGFKHSIDDRYSIEDIASHNGKTFKGIPVKDPEQILSRVVEKNGVVVVAIDEAQFFDQAIVDVVKELAYKRDKRVIIAGLDMDFRAQPFGPMPQLLCLADDVTKLHAICVTCGEEATRTQRLVNGKPAYFDDAIVVVGASENYEPRCVDHHKVTVKSEHGEAEVNPSLIKDVYVAKSLPHS